MKFSPWENFKVSLTVISKMEHQHTLSEIPKHKIATCELQWLCTYPWIYVRISILFHANPLHQTLEKAFVNYNPMSFYKIVTSLDVPKTFKIVLFAMNHLQKANCIPLAWISSMILYVQGVTVTSAKDQNNKHLYVASYSEQ